jgi:hypothetical protein
MSSSSIKFTSEYKNLENFESSLDDEYKKLSELLYQRYIYKTNLCKYPNLEKKKLLEDNIKNIDKTLNKFGHDILRDLNNDILNPTRIEDNIILQCKKTIFIEHLIKKLNLCVYYFNKYNKEQKEYINFVDLYDFKIDHFINFFSKIFDIFDNMKNIDAFDNIEQIKSSYRIKLLKTYRIKLLKEIKTNDITCILRDILIKEIKNLILKDRFQDIQENSIAYNLILSGSEYYVKEKTNYSIRLYEIDHKGETNYQYQDKTKYQISDNVKKQIIETINKIKKLSKKYNDLTETEAEDSLFNIKLIEESIDSYELSIFLKQNADIRFEGADSNAIQVSFEDNKESIKFFDNKSELFDNKSELDYIIKLLSNNLDNNKYYIDLGQKNNINPNDQDILYKNYEIFFSDILNLTKIITNNIIDKNNELMSDKSKTIFEKLKYIRDSMKKDANLMNLINKKITLYYRADDIFLSEVSFLDIINIIKYDIIHSDFIYNSCKGKFKILNEIEKARELLDILFIFQILEFEEDKNKEIYQIYQRLNKDIKDSLIESMINNFNKLFKYIYSFLKKEKGEISAESDFKEYINNVSFSEKLNKKLLQNKDNNITRSIIIHEIENILKNNQDSDFIKKIIYGDVIVYELQDNDSLSKIKEKLLKINSINNGSEFNENDNKLIFVKCINEKKDDKFINLPIISNLFSYKNIVYKKDIFLNLMKSCNSIENLRKEKVTYIKKQLKYTSFKEVFSLKRKLYFVEACLYFILKHIAILFLIIFSIIIPIFISIFFAFGVFGTKEVLIFASLIILKSKGVLYISSKVKEIFIYICKFKSETIDEFIFSYLYKQLSKIIDNSLFEISYIKSSLIIIYNIIFLISFMFIISTLYDFIRFCIPKYRIHYKLDIINDIIAKEFLKELNSDIDKYIFIDSKENKIKNNEKKNLKQNKKNSGYLYYLSILLYLFTPIIRIINILFSFIIRMEYKYTKNQCFTKLINQIEKEITAGSVLTVLKNDDVMNLLEPLYNDIEKIKTASHIKTKCDIFKIHLLQNFINKILDIFFKDNNFIKMTEDEFRSKIDSISNDILLDLEQNNNSKPDSINLNDEIKLIANKLLASEIFNKIKARNKIINSLQFIFNYYDAAFGENSKESNIAKELILKEVIEKNLDEYYKEKIY